jgi:hypothetical protein
MMQSWAMIAQSWTMIPQEPQPMNDDNAKKEKDKAKKTNEIKKWNANENLVLLISGQVLEAGSTILKRAKQPRWMTDSNWYCVYHGTLYGKEKKHKWNVNGKDPRRGWFLVRWSTDGTTLKRARQSPWMTQENLNWYWTHHAYHDTMQEKEKERKSEIPTRKALVVCDF